MPIGVESYLDLHFANTYNREIVKCLLSRHYEVSMCLLARQNGNPTHVEYVVSLKTLTD